MLYISSNTLSFSSFPRAAFIAFSQAHRAEIAEERRMRERERGRGEKDLTGNGGGGGVIYLIDYVRFYTAIGGLC